MVIIPTTHTITVENPVPHGLTRPGAGANMDALHPVHELVLASHHREA
jgi:hypothetical protein